jgi:carbon-monoxide dehydrogenase small subunit
LRFEAKRFYLLTLSDSDPQAKQSLPLILKEKMDIAIKFILNGKPFQVEVPAHWTLLKLLREKIGLTGTKEGCGIGECGACTVLLDGMPVNACLVLAPKVEGRKIETIEGLGSRDSLHPLQKSFIDHGAIQCGFCTPGILMSSKALLEKSLHPSRDEIKDAISGHLCRCTGYHQIVEAIENTLEVRGSSPLQGDLRLKVK